MGKAVIVKVFVGSLLGFAAALVIFAMAGALALANDSFIMNGPDVVGIRTDPFGWTMIGLAATAVLVMISATLGLVVAWIGAVLNTANLADKTWFIVVLAGGLLSVGFLVTVAYVIAGPDGQPTTVPTRNGRVSLSRHQHRTAGLETARAPDVAQSRSPAQESPTAAGMRSAD